LTAVHEQKIKGEQEQRNDGHASADDKLGHSRRNHPAWITGQAFPAKPPQDRPGTLKHKTLLHRFMNIPATKHGNANHSTSQTKGLGTP
jgi:hypothetical protein